MAKKSYSATDLGRLIGVDRGTLARWVDAGCPAEKVDGGGGRGTWSFDPAAVFAWVQDRAKMEARRGHEGATAADLERSKARVDLELAELKLEELRGVLVRVDDVLEIVGQDYDAVRKSLHSIPARVGPELWAKIAGGLGENEAVEVLERVVDDALGNLSGERLLARGLGAAADPVKPDSVATGSRRPRKGSRGKAAATPEAKPKRVGRRKPPA